MINIDSTISSRSGGSDNLCGLSDGKLVANSSATIERSQNVDRKSILDHKECLKFRDANNNKPAPHKQTEAISVDNCKDNSLPTLSSDDDSLSLETEDWQLLEVDEHLDSTDHDMGETTKMDKTTIIDNGNSISYVNGNGNSHPAAAADPYGATKSDSGSKKYLDIDPLESQNKYSPALIYLCTAIYSIIPVASLLSVLILVGLLFTRFYFITLLYVGYVIWDRNTCNRGGRRLNIVYCSKFWSYLAAYFPIKLRHSTEFKLDPSENYILNYHPHGIAAFGAVTAFATNGLNFSKLFPGIKARFMVHETSFVMPILKEAFSLRGDCSVNSKSIDYMLSKNSTGNLLTIVVGGLAEADLSDSETLKTVIVERKGFVKKALIHGANLIPCIAFGENSVFTKVDLKPDSFMYRLQTKWYQLFKFKHPIYYGRGILSQGDKGLMPYKRPITVVMGDPIRVKRVVDPTQDDIDNLHATYLKQLRAIYEANGDLRVKYDTKMELL